MKKIFTVLFVVASLGLALPAQAQGVKFGVKGGLDVTEMKFDESVVDKENKAGFFIGPTVKVSLPAGFGFDAAAFYNQKKSEVNGEELKQELISIPVNVRYNIGLGSIAGIYLAAGPQIGFNIGDTDLSWSNALNDAGNIVTGALTGGNTSSSTQATLNNTFQFKKSNFSINLGAGVTLLKHFEVGFTYNIPLGKTADLENKYSNIVSGAQNAYNDVTGDVKAHSWQVSAAFYF